MVAILVLVVWNLGHRVLNMWSLFAIFNAKNSEFVWTVLPLVYVLLFCMPRYWYIYGPRPIGFEGTDCTIVVPTGERPSILCRGERPSILCRGLSPSIEDPHRRCARIFVFLGPSRAHQAISSVFSPVHVPSPWVTDFESACFSGPTENSVAGWRGDIRLSDIVPGHHGEIETLHPFPPAPPVPPAPPAPPMPPAPPGPRRRIGIGLIRPPRNN